MLKDPGLPWPAPFPYDVLAPAGVGPHTTHAQMQEVSFTLMERGLMGTATQTAWHELRSVEGRLLVDLLLYDADPAAEVPARLAALAAEEEAASGAEEPPEVAACLSLRRADFDELAGELRPLPPPPPAREAVSVPELERVDALELVEDFLRFDR
ncbi:hypothetical protein ACFQLX_19885 [Streptomyces polyrhachis]|uniref:Uncharacterized protein n=1 Tax=Streptomyces polyrhachis TaxID=1282885 RepID=A0ABW2GNB3_9ACTN